MQTLYNTYVKFALWETGWRTDSVRRMARGTSLFQLQEMLKEHGALHDMHLLRAVVKCERVTGQASKVTMVVAS